MPINTIHNWMTEFNSWLPLDDDDVPPRGFNLFALNDSRITESARSEIINQWAENGGILLIGYEMFRLLTTKEFRNVEKEGGSTISRRMYNDLINPGADLIICDEGHRIKNSNAIRSLRRIVLTGFPLQNNLIEYWCMIDFVQPNYLGTKNEFSDYFETPIKNGKYSDSSEEIKQMNWRSYVLHTILRPIVQRRSNAVVEKALPKKHDYVIPLKMTSIQKDLYSAFEKEILSKSFHNLLIIFAVGSKIWNHPDILYDYLKNHSNSDFKIDDKNATMNNRVMDCDWALDCLTNYLPNVIENSAKMQIFSSILSESLRQGDKVLLFSQSLRTLDLIQKFLHEDTIEGTDMKWKENCNYFRKNVFTRMIQFQILNLFPHYIHRIRWINFFKASRKINQRV